MFYYVAAMLPGYNTDVQHGGEIYHVQTEDNGEANPSIVTLIYQKGAILARRKSDYGHLLKNPSFREDVRNLMREQHREMIKRLMEGKLEPQTPQAKPSSAEEPRKGTLDGTIMRFLTDLEE